MICDMKPASSNGADPNPYCLSVRPSVQPGISNHHPSQGRLPTNSDSMYQAMETLHHAQGKPRPLLRPRPRLEDAAKVDPAQVGRPLPARRRLGRLARPRPLLTRLAGERREELFLLRFRVLPEIFVVDHLARRGAAGWVERQQAARRAAPAEVRRGNLARIRVVVVVRVEVEGGRTMLRAVGRRRKPGQESSVGTPQSSKVFASWSTSLVPARSGLWVSSSPKTQPTLQRSMAEV